MSDSVDTHIVVVVQGKEIVSEWMTASDAEQQLTGIRQIQEANDGQGITDLPWLSIRGSAITAAYTQKG
jgi:hypothetical protein